MPIFDRARTIGRLPELDGWRAISILCVLAGHMLPLGPKAWGLNGAVATSGMAIFFTLSGFLIVSILMRQPSVLPFLIRRVFRIVPLAWAVLVVVLAIDMAAPAYWSANFLFYANLPPFYLDYAGHFWSLCLEMQFYLAIAIVVGLCGRNGLWLVPIAALLVTAARIMTGTEGSIVTWLRVDEIMAGGSLAILLQSGWRPIRAAPLVLLAPYLLGPLLIASAHAETGALNYLRPYIAAGLVGTTLMGTHAWLRQVLVNRVLGYIAQISFALYVIHPFTTHGWLGAGDTAVRYAKRPLSFAITFLLAHLSTFHYERWWIALGHRLAARAVRHPDAVAPPFKD